MNDSPYVVDASALINLYHNYPIQKITFEQVWQEIGKLFEEGKIISSSEIFEEIKDEKLKEWIQQYKSSFIELDRNTQLKVTEILNKFPQMINIYNPKKSSSNGDPFLIATAMIKNGIIVTDEGNGNNKIPAICKCFEIKTINSQQFINNILV